MELINRLICIHSNRRNPNPPVRPKHAIRSIGLPFICTAVLLALLSCSAPSSGSAGASGSYDGHGNGGPGGDITVPPQFTQKVLIESAMGTWGAGCPDADAIVDDLQGRHEGQVYGLSYYVYESAHPELECAGAEGLLELVDHWFGSVPLGCVSRLPDVEGGGDLVMSRHRWEANVLALLPELADTVADCGLRVDTRLDGQGAEIDVYVGFGEPGGLLPRPPDEPLYLSVVLVEDGVTGYAQCGYPGEYTHNRVARAILSPMSPTYGDPIEAEDVKEGSCVVRTYAIDLPEFTVQDWENVRVFAFVHENPAGPGDRRVHNVQVAPLGECRGWD